MGVHVYSYKYMYTNYEYVLIFFHTLKYLTLSLFYIYHQFMVAVIMITFIKAHLTGESIEH